MARGDPEIRVRIPEDLKSQIEESAREHSRSLSGEVTLRLKKSLSRPFQESTEPLSPTEFMLINLFREADESRQSEIKTFINKIFWRGK